MRIDIKMRTLNSLEEISSEDILQRLLVLSRNRTRQSISVDWYRRVSSEDEDNGEAVVSGWVERFCGV